MKMMCNVPQTFNFMLIGMGNPLKTIILCWKQYIAFKINFLLYERGKIVAVSTNQPLMYKLQEVCHYLPQFVLINSDRL